MIKSFRQFINEAAADDNEFNFFDHEGDDDQENTEVPEADDHDGDVDFGIVKERVQQWVGDNIKMIGKRKIMLVLEDTGDDGVHRRGDLTLSKRIKYIDASRIKDDDIDGMYDGDGLSILCIYNIGGADDYLLDKLVTRVSSNVNIFLATGREYNGLLENNPSVVLRFDGIWKI